MTFLLQLLFAHILADFLFQADSLVIKKENKEFKGFVYHGLIVFITQVILTFNFFSLKTLVVLFLISLLHIVIDLGKVSLIDYYEKVLNRKYPGSFDFYTFLIDQLLHLVIIFIAFSSYVPVQNVIVSNLFYQILNTSAVSVFGQTISKRNSSIDLNNVLAVLAVYLFVCFGGAVLVQKFLGYLYRKKAAGFNADFKVGRYIGILERFIILTLVLNGSISSVAIVFTAKSIARHNELGDKQFAEYYLLGTLTSSIVAIVGGLLLNFYIR